MKKRLRKRFLIPLALLGSLLLVTLAYLQLPKFGRLPAGERLVEIRTSPHYVNGRFRNTIPTLMLTEDSGFISALFDGIFVRTPRLVPAVPVPSIYTDLKTLDTRRDLVIWLGHSSFYVQLGGKRLLIDPVFSLNAAPVPFANQAFQGSSPYAAQDVPDIDYLLITHDHWDHLDYPSLKVLQPRVRHVFTGLGVGASLERWGYTPQKIREADWWATIDLDEDLRLHVLPARHYSGRLLTRDQTLWVSYVLETSQRRLYFSGDSGYGPHFAEIGNRLGDFDLVSLDSGQYDRRWPHIHMFPEESAQAAVDLHARALIPAHTGRFSISRHAWDDPFKRIALASQEKPYRLLTPRIGEPIALDDDTQRFPHWWEALE